MKTKTYEEIIDQVGALNKTLSYILDNSSSITQFLSDASPKKFLVMGCGSSYFISKSIAAAISTVTSKEAYCIPSGDFMLHPEKYSRYIQNAVIIALSRSGATHEMLYAIKKAKEMSGCRVLSVICKEETELEKLSEFSVKIPWAFDASVCQTRSVSNIYTAARLIVDIMANVSDFRIELEQFIEHGASLLEAYSATAQRLAALPWKKVYILVDGEIGGITEEASLAFTEISMLPSFYNHLLDIRHGPILLIDQNTLVITASADDSNGYQDALLQDLIHRGATLIAFHETKGKAIDGIQENMDLLGSSVSPVTGLQVLVLSQFLSYYKAVENGINPDSPSGLDPWISLSK